MVGIQEAKQQVVQARVLLDQQAQRIKTAQANIKGGPTQQSLFKQRQSQAKAGLNVQAFQREQARRAEQQSQIAQARVDLKERRQAVSDFSKQIIVQEKARDEARIRMGEERGQRISLGQQHQQKKEKERIIIEELASQGLEPIISQGKIVGATDGLQTIHLSSIDFSGTTATERELQMSLPLGIRDTSVEEFRARQSLLPPEEVRTSPGFFGEGGFFKGDKIGGFQVPDFDETVKTTGRDLQTLALTPVRALQSIKEEVISFVPQETQERFELFRGRTLEKADIASTKLEEVKVGFEELVDPSQKELRQQEESIRKFVEKENKKLSKDIEKFNKQFSGDLSESELNLASQQQKDLNLRIERLNIQSEQALGRLKEKKKDIEFGGGPLLFGISAVKGFATAPISLTQFGIGVATRPVSTFGETIEGIKQLPGELVQTPFSLTGRLAGEFAFAGVFSEAVVSSLSRTQTLTKVRKIPSNKRLTTGSFEVGDAIKVGENQYLVKTKFVSKVVDKRTGKVVDTIKTVVDSKIVTATTEEGAIQGVGRSVAASLKKGGIRKFTKENKVTIKKDIIKSETTFTLTPSEIEGFLEGTSKAELSFFGTQRGVVRVGKREIGISSKITERKAKPSFGGLSDIKVRVGEPTPAARKVGEGRFLIGTETPSVTGSITDIFGTRFGVRGFKRTLPSGSITRVRPQVRRFAKEQKPSRAKTVSVATSFESKLGFIDLGKAGTNSIYKPRGPPAKLPKKTITPKDFNELIAGRKPSTPKPTPKQPPVSVNKLITGQQPTQQGTIAKAIAQEEARQIAGVLKKQVEKPTTKKETITKVTKPPITREQVTAGSLIIGRDINLDTTKVGVIDLDTTKVKEIEFTGLKGRTLLGTKKDVKTGNLFGTIPATGFLSGIISKERARQTPTQRLGQPQLLKQPQLLRTAFTQPVIPTTATIGLITPPTTIRKRFVVPRRRKKGVSKKKIFSYHAEVRSKGRYRRVTTKPVRFATAKSIGGRIVDNTTSRRFRVVRGKKIKKPRQPADTTFKDILRPKFRTFSQKKGVRRPLQRTFIERSRFAIDTPGERRGITARSLIKRRQKSQIRNAFGF